MWCFLKPTNVAWESENFLLYEGVSSWNLISRVFLFCFWLGLFFPKGVNCGDGLIIPIWKPYDILTGGERFGRGVLYIILMVWLFIGVSIVSDRFMESIEMITAQEKEVTLKDPKTGRNQTVIVKVSCIKGIPNK